MSDFVEVPRIRTKFGKDSFIFGVGINDAAYKVTLKVGGKLSTCPYYRTWKNLLARLYCPAFLISNPTYINCTITPAWLSFTNFKAWMEQQDWKGKQLDKDILVKNNKHYSPETCMFIPPRVNKLLNNQDAGRGTCKLGVSYRTDSKNFKASCNDGFKVVSLGSFATEDEAHLTYLKFKKTVIINCANEQTDLRLKQALLTIADSYII